MDKSCQTCTNYTDTCRKCVNSGTFGGWVPAGCNGCAHEPHGKLYGFGSVTPCVDCQRYFPKSDADYYEAKVIADSVNHPTHYTSGCGFECIEMMEMVFGKEVVIDYCVVNAFKYIWRHKQKNGTEDIAKAEWYLKYASKLAEGGLRRHLTAINKMTDHIEKLKGENAE